MEITAAVEALAALAQESRLKVFRLLVHQGQAGMAAGDIARALSVPNNTMSAHLAAAALGYAVWWITAIGQEEIQQRVRPLLGVPEPLAIIDVMCFGPPAKASYKRWKKRLDQILHWGRFDAAQAMTEFMGHALPVDMDTVIAGAILADVGKLLEYEKVSGKAVQSERGKLLRHPFTGVALAMEAGVPDRVCHIIAAHADEGNLVKRSTEAYIVHHADFMSFLPFKNLAT